MVSTLTNQTFSTTYKDDFSDSAGFHRILFNSGKALQARELNQLQTILQEQISRFGNNIFKEGGVVKPGGVNLNNRYEFVKLAANTLPTDTSTIINQDMTGTTSTVVAKIIEVLPASQSDIGVDTLYVQYVNTGSSGGSTTKRFVADEDLTVGSETMRVQGTNTTENPAVGAGIQATILSGVYYVAGHFVFTQNLSKIISQYSDNANTEIGFKTLEQVVTAADDVSLYDNQGTNPNLTAPGADRYRITLTFAERNDVNSDENFVHVATIKNGVIYNAVSDTNSYNIPNKVIAERIKENSGDYFVKPFIVNFSKDSENTHLLLNVSPGVAVVEGYRAARDFPTTLRIPKPTETITFTNEPTQIEFGNYVVVDPSVNTSNKKLPNIATFEKLNLRDTADYGGSTIGTARVKAVNEDGTLLRYYLFDIQMNSGNSFRQVKSIGTSGTQYFEPVLENSSAVIKEPLINQNLFGLSHPRPKNITPVSFAVQRRFTGLTTDGGGSVSLSGLGSNEVFTNEGDWIIGTDSDIFQPSSLTGDASTTITGAGAGATITGLPPNQSVQVLAYVNKSNPTARQKVLTTTTKSFSVVDKQINLAKADIFSVDEIVKATDSSLSYAGDFIVDNGQRDNHYGLGKLILRSGRTAPTGDVSVTFRHFTHQGGDFFSANSYDGQVDYSQIPSHRFSNGRRIFLRNFLDFRSIMDSAGEFTDASKGAIVNEIPQPGTLVLSTNEYYLAKTGKLVIDREGSIRYFNGTAGFNPGFPDKPENTLGLYDIRLNANTDNDSDVEIRAIRHKRHTMKDITNIEKRIDKLEEITSLNLLELDTKHFEVLDSAGNDRTKSGFFVDNFNNHRGSEIDRLEYRAAIDPVNHLLRPAFQEDNVKLVFDSDASLALGTVRKGDNIYMSFTEDLYIDQKDATTAIRINPFNIAIYEGTITLSPASDEWRDVERLPDVSIPGETVLNLENAYNWNNWSWSWGGIPTDELQVGSETAEISSAVNRVVSDKIVLDLIEDRVIQTAFIPFCRARQISFKATGLRPNTKHFAFIDGFNLGNLVREENTFINYSTVGTDPGNTLKEVYTHPSGAPLDNLVSDPNGEIIGSFIVPSNNDKKVRTGTVKFKLMDINVDKEEDAGSFASAAYTATGYLDTKEASYTATRVLGVQGYYFGGGSDNQGSSGGDDGGDPGPGTSIDASNANDTAGDAPGNEFGGNENSGMGDPGASGADNGPGGSSAGMGDPGASGAGAGDSTGAGPGCVIATHGVSTGGFTLMEKTKAEIWCAKTYHGKWYGEAFRRGYKAWGMSHINAGTAPNVYQEFKDFVAYGRGLKKDFKTAINYYRRTLQLFVWGLFIK